MGEGAHHQKRRTQALRLSQQCRTQRPGPGIEPSVTCLDPMPHQAIYKVEIGAVEIRRGEHRYAFGRAKQVHRADDRARRV